MGIFDQIGKKVTEAGSNVAQQTKNLAEITRLNGEISDEEHDLSNAFAALGQMYYQEHVADESTDYADIMATITQSYSNIAQWKEEIKQIRGITKCPRCNTDVPIDATFCSVCGERIVREVPNEIPGAEIRKAKKSEISTVTCPNCGASVSAANKFCNKCGAKMPDSANTDLSE